MGNKVRPHERELEDVLKNILSRAKNSRSIEIDIFIN